MSKTNGDPPELIPFSFPDLEDQNANYLDAIKKEADQILAETREKIQLLKEKANQELNNRRIALDNFETKLIEAQKNLNAEAEELEKKTFEEAYQEGFEKGVTEGNERGYAEGMANVERECQKLQKERVQDLVRQKMDEILPVLNNMSREMLNTRQILLKYWESNILQIASAIAYQTIMREIPKTAEISYDLLKEALELVVGSASIKIRMNPGDLEELRDPIEKLTGELENNAKVELEADPKVTSAGCVIETSTGTVDQRLESRMKRIIDELSQ